MPHLDNGKSRWARLRRKRASVLGAKFRYGDRDAQMRLAQRGFALIGIAKYGPMYRIPFMLAALARKREKRAEQLAQSVVAEAERRAAIVYARNGPSETNREPDICGKFGCGCAGTKPGHFAKKPWQ